MSRLSALRAAIYEGRHDLARPLVRLSDPVALDYAVGHGVKPWAGGCKGLGYGNGYGDGDGHGNGDGCGNGDGHGNGCGDGDGHGNGDGSGYSNDGLGDCPHQIEENDPMSRQAALEARDLRLCYLSDRWIVIGWFSATLAEFEVHDAIIIHYYRTNTLGLSGVAMYGPDHSGINLNLSAQMREGLAFRAPLGKLACSWDCDQTAWSKYFPKEAS